MNDVITVVRDPINLLGKMFWVDDGGKIKKKSAVSVSYGIAVMHHIPSISTLRELIASVAEDPHAAIINAGFHGIEIGEEFAIASESWLKKKGIKRDENKPAAPEVITAYGKSLKTLGRFKENIYPSTWQLLDRDIDEHTPERFCIDAMPFEQWVSAVDKILPGLDGADLLVVQSSSARVFYDGAPVGKGNGHVWVQIKEPQDVSRTRLAIRVRAAESGLSWLKPKFSRETGEQIGSGMLTTIIDPSVWTPGRLVFCGKPVVGDELLTVKAQDFKAINGWMGGPIDTSLAEFEPNQVSEITRKAGCEMKVSKEKNGQLRVTMSDLTLDTELERGNGSLITVRNALKLEEINSGRKMRCQTPFRESSSCAAFFSLGKQGKPFVFDSGDDTTHWLNDDDWDDIKVECALITVQRAIQLAEAGDCGAPFEDDVIHAFALVRQADNAEFQRLRGRIKNSCKGVSITKLEKEIESQFKQLSEEEEDIGIITHHGYATRLLEEMAIDQWNPVGHHQSLYVVKNNIWVRVEDSELERRVAESFDGGPNCGRRNDYVAIAGHAISVASKSNYFSEAPIGIACPDGFFRVTNKGISKEPLSPDHRQRIILDYSPTVGPTPLFDQFLQDTFKSDKPGETEEQIALVQEIAGTILLGNLYKYQFAVLFYDPYGRAGKGTLERILRRLVPKEFTSAVSPMFWDKEYYIASLAGMRLNVVGELPENECIPAAAFKTVTGGDLLTGRHPTHRPISFQNEAAHLFMSNNLIQTRDHSEAFYTRWRIVEFPNSRLASGLSLDPELADRIIKNEMPQIAAWALEGAQRLIKRGKFLTSSAHDRLMNRWRNDSNSVLAFIHEECDIGNQSYLVKRADFYSDYVSWCHGAGKKPFSRNSVFELIEKNLSLSARHSILDGYDVYRGIRFKSEFMR